MTFFVIRIGILLTRQASMKKCQFCAEEVKDDALKCKHCGEMLNGKKKNNSSFQQYEEWLHQRYPAYRISSKNYEGQYIVINKEYNPFNIGIFILLLLLFVIPAFVYLLVTITRKKYVAVTIAFDDEGRANIKQNKGYSFLADNYNRTLGTN